MHLSPNLILDSTVYNTCVYYDYNFAIAGDESECTSLESCTFFKTESVDSYTKLVARYLHACIRHTGELSAVQRIMLARMKCYREICTKLRISCSSGYLLLPTRNWLCYLILEMMSLVHAVKETESEEYYYLVPSNTLGVMTEGANPRNSK